MITKFIQVQTIGHNYIADKNAGEKETNGKSGENNKETAPVKHAWQQNLT